MRPPVLAAGEGKKGTRPDATARVASESDGRAARLAVAVKLPAALPTPVKKYELPRELTLAPSCQPAASEGAEDQAQCPGFGRRRNEAISWGIARRPESDGAGV